MVLYSLVVPAGHFRALRRASLARPDIPRAGADLPNFAELHVVHALCSQSTYLAYFVRSPPLSLAPSTGPAPFFTDTQIELLEGARDAEGEANPDQEDVKHDEKDRQADGARVEARGGTLYGAAARAEGATIEEGEEGK